MSESINTIISKAEGHASDALGKAATNQTTAIDAAGGYSEVPSQTVPDLINSISTGGLQEVDYDAALLGLPNADGLPVYDQKTTLDLSNTPPVWDPLNVLDTEVTNKDAIDATMLSLAESLKTWFRDDYDAAYTKLQGVIDAGIASAIMSAEDELRAYVEQLNEVEDDRRDQQQQSRQTTAHTGPLPNGAMLDPFSRVSRASAKAAGTAAAKVYAEMRAANLDHIQACIAASSAARQSMMHASIAYVAVVLRAHAYAESYAQHAVQALIADAQTRIKALRAEVAAYETKVKAIQTEADFAFQPQVKLLRSITATRYLKLRTNMGVLRARLQREIHRARQDVERLTINSDLYLQKVATTAATKVAAGAVYGGMAVGAAGAQNTLAVIEESSA